MPYHKPDWEKIYDALRRPNATTDQDRYHNANWETVKDTLEGSAAYAGGQGRAGICAVVNLPAARALWFLLPPSKGPGCGVYENRYRNAARVGAALPSGSAREKIDQALEDISDDPKLTKTSGHYAAVELNGTGIRYFGDICLVLKADTVEPKTLTLLRNSFEVRVAPAASKLDGLRGRAYEQELRQVLADWAGQWDPDGVFIAASRIMENRPDGTRRMTTGAVSDGVLEDEDYIELILSHGFAHSGVDEIRVTAEDAGAEALIGDQAHVGMAPSGAAALWRFRRRITTMLARRIPLTVRVVTTTGRTR
jgi:hypothetical protein